MLFFFPLSVGGMDHHGNPSAFRWSSFTFWSAAIQWPAWPRCRCAPPAWILGRRLRQEDALRDRRGGAIVRRGPGAPRGSQIPSCDGRPLAPFHIRTISLNPLIPAYTDDPSTPSPLHLTGVSLWSCPGIQSQMAWRSKTGLWSNISAGVAARSSGMCLKVLDCSHFYHMTAVDSRLEMSKRETQVGFLKPARVFLFTENPDSQAENLLALQRSDSIHTSIILGHGLERRIVMQKGIEIQTAGWAWEKGTTEPEEGRRGSALNGFGTVRGEMLRGGFGWNPHRWLRSCLLQVFFCSFQVTSSSRIFQKWGKLFKLR